MVEGGRGRGGGAPLPSATPPPAPVMSSSPHGEGESRRSSKRRRSPSGDALGDRALVTAISRSSTSQGDGSPSVTGPKRFRATRAATTTFPDGNNDAYGDWLNAIQRNLHPLTWPDQPKFASYIGKRVAVKSPDSDDWWTGVVSSLFVSPHARSSRRVPSDSSVHPSTGQPFTVVWSDNTDSTVDQETLQEWIENAKHQGSTPSAGSTPSQMSRTSSRARRSAEGLAPRIPPPPSHPPPTHGNAAPSLPPPPHFGLFAGIPTRPGDFLDLTAAKGGLSFLETLHEKTVNGEPDGLFQLRDFRLTKLLPQAGEALDEFRSTMKLVMKLSQAFPDRSPARYILRIVAHFLPALILPNRRRGRSKHIIKNARTFRAGGLKELWEQAVRYAEKEKALREARRPPDGGAPRPRSRTQRAKTAVRYAQRGALSKANQAATSKLEAKADPAYADLLQDKHPKPCLAQHDPRLDQDFVYPDEVSAPDLTAYWDSPEGKELLQDHFSTQHIVRYFRTRSPVATPDIDSWLARDLVAPLLCTDDPEFQDLVRDTMVLPFLLGDFHDAHKGEMAGGLLLALQKPDQGGIRPIACGDLWRRCFACSQQPAQSSF